MARIAGIDLPGRQHVVIALQAIYGIGPTRAKKICEETGVSPSEHMHKISEDTLEKMRACVAKYTVEGDLRRENMLNIKRLKDIKCYRGLRHQRGLPVRGQRTKTNAQTRKKRGGVIRAKVVGSPVTAAKKG